MKILTHKQYDKAWVKLTAGQQQRVLVAIKLFMTEPRHPQLRLHQLKGGYYPQYSLSAGGDLRIHFLYKDVGSNDTIVLMLVGTHSQLYG